jgi:ribonuclease HI
MLTHAPILTLPRDGEPLYLYVTATTQVVSAVIVVERTEEGHALAVQRPVYYISKVLSETNARYPQIQKLLYAVVLARRKLRHYFEVHPFTVVSSFPLGEIIHNPDATGRIAKWSVELMGETLAYAPHKAIKSQILADFVAEWTDTQLPLPQILAECWTLYFDRSVMKTGAGAGLLFISPLGEHMRYAVRLYFPASNNMVEYEALLCGLKIAIETGIKRLGVRGASQLVIDQVMKNGSCHDDKMEVYYNAVRALEDRFYDIELNHVLHRYNEEADELAKIASGWITVPSNIFARDIARPSVNLELAPSSQEEPSGAPSNPTGAEPMDEDPSNEVFVLSLLEGYGADEAEAMDTEPAPPRGGLARQIHRLDGSRGTSLRPIRGQTHRQDGQVVLPRRRRAVQAHRFRRPAAMRAHPLGARAPSRHSRGHAATTQCRAPSSATHSARSSIGPPRLLMPTRSCAPARGANFTPAKLTSRLTPSRRFPSHGLFVGVLDRKPTKGSTRGR